MINSLLKSFSFFLIIALSSSIDAEANSQLNKLRKTAEEFAKNHIPMPKDGKLTLKAAKLDPRLKIVDCLEPMSSSFAGQQNFMHRVTVLISCPSKNWQVYIPVDIDLLLPTVVVNRNFSRDEILSKKDLSIKILSNRFHQGQTYAEMKSIIGAKVKRRIAVNSPIRKQDICMVCKNDKVVILSSNEFFAIEAKGEALHDGILGEQIDVRNIRSDKIITGRVSALGKVKVE